jgi:hypothetical protein
MSVASFAYAGKAAAMALAISRRERGLPRVFCPGSWCFLSFLGRAGRCDHRLLRDLLGLIDLIEGAAVREMRFLGFGPTTGDFIHRQ